MPPVPRAILKFDLAARRVRTTRPSYSPSAKQERRAGKFALLLLIFVENHSINHHVVSRANVVNPDRSADFHSRLYDIFIEHLTASSHVSDCLTKMVRPRSAAFLEHDYVARSILGDRSVALGSGRCCRCL